MREGIWTSSFFASFSCFPLPGTSLERAFSGIRADSLSDSLFRESVISPLMRVKSAFPFESFWASESILLVSSRASFRIFFASVTALAYCSSRLFR